MTKFNRLRVFILLIFFTARPIAAQPPLDIDGVQLGRPGNSELRMEIENRGEGYRCLEIHFNLERDVQGKINIRDDQYGQGPLMGYSCFAPQAPATAFGDRAHRQNMDILTQATHHLFFLFDEETHETWFIFKNVSFKSSPPAIEELTAALTEKYGPHATSDLGQTLATLLPQNGWFWNRNGEKLKRPPLTFWLNSKFETIFKKRGTPAIIESAIVKIPNSFQKNDGVTLIAHLESAGKTCSAYNLTLFDPRKLHDRQLAVKKR